MANTTSTSTTKPATSRSASSGSKTMAELLKKQQPKISSFKKGDMVEGTITKLTSYEILVDLHGKGEAWVLEKDKSNLRNILSTLKVGDSVTVQILSPEGETGTPVVSLRRFMEGRVWNRLENLKQEKKTLKVTVDGTTRGGFMVSTKDNLAGFLPNSHASMPAGGLIGKEVEVAVLELDRPSKKVIFSQKQAVGVEDFRKQIKVIKTGQKITSTITNIVSFGMFTTIPLPDENSVDGFIHISEASWERVEDLNDEFNVGEDIEAVVLGVDEDARRIKLSVKKLTPDVFEDKIKALPIDSKTRGKVVNVSGAGVLLSLNEGLEGFIKKEKIPPTVNYSQGEEINVTVSEVDKRKRRLNVVPVLLEKPIGYR